MMNSMERSIKRKTTRSGGDDRCRMKKTDPEKMQSTY
jgi:hypothetical protein